MYLDFHNFVQGDIPGINQGQKKPLKSIRGHIYYFLNILYHRNLQPFISLVHLRDILFPQSFDGQVPFLVTKPGLAF